MCAVVIVVAYIEGEEIRRNVTGQRSSLRISRGDGREKRVR